jgi:CRISPR-associated protein Cmr2
MKGGFMKHLFVCGIGPVQDFIATARRSQDLWYGSWILSELSKAAARKVAESYPDSLVFPAPIKPDVLKPDSDLNTPNKIVAIVDGDPKSLAEDVRVAIWQQLKHLREEALGNVKGPFDETLALRQIDDLPEYYWVSVPLKSDADYAMSRAQADALLAARKTTRDFSQ